VCGEQQSNGGENLTDDSMEATKGNSLDLYGGKELEFKKPLKDHVLMRRQPAHGGPRLGGVTENEGGH